MRHSPSSEEQSIWRVFVSPQCDVFYCSYYLQGLFDVFGRQHVRFLRGTFPLSNERHAMAFEVWPPGYKVFIDASDGTNLQHDAYEWCHVYAKVNSAGQSPSCNKMVAIGPSFGIRVFGFPRTVLLSIRNLLARRSSVRAAVREHLANYSRQYCLREPISAYAPCQTSDDYVFFASSLWKNEPAANAYRANFMRACRDNANIQFEGGFAPRQRNDVAGYENLSAKRRYPYPEYMEKLKKSALAFNTPAVLDCHGWKLGEDLALGKAIITTALTRELPAPLDHGLHVHFVDGSYRQMFDAVELLRADVSYRRELERNARKYWLDNLSPNKCIERILAFLRLKHSGRSRQSNDC